MLPYGKSFSCNMHSTIECMYAHMFLCPYVRMCCKMYFKCQGIETSQVCVSAEPLKVSRFYLPHSCAHNCTLSSNFTPKFHCGTSKTTTTTELPAANAGILLIPCNHHFASCECLIIICCRCIFYRYSNIKDTNNG